MSQFEVTDLPLDGLKLIKRCRHKDNRGFLSRLFCANELYRFGWCKPIQQINYTSTLNRGTIRGMHYQRTPHAEMKLVSCLSGEVWDVAIDLRRDSKTFLKWYAVRLSEENGLSLLIPEGFAHGFQTLTDNVELIYCHSTQYAPAFESGLNFADKRLSITWPLEIFEISMKDSQHPLIDQNFLGLII